MKVLTRHYKSIKEIMRANEARGHYFFESGNMRFFNSRVHSNVYGGRYFVTSEQYDYNTPRKYTVREALPDGQVVTVNNFQQYSTREQAHAAARNLANKED